jgi:hypothetical protein
MAMQIPVSELTWRGRDHGDRTQNPAVRAISSVSSLFHFCCPKESGGLYLQKTDLPSLLRQDVRFAGLRMG